MSYKVIVTYNDKDGEQKSESAQLSAKTRRDAEFQKKINREIAEKKYGKDNVVSVELEEE